MSQIYAPNLNKNVTATDLGGGHVGLDISGSITTTEGATVANGGALPAVVKVVAGYDGANVRVLATDTTGKLLPAGRTAVGKATHDHTTPVTTAAYTQLTASTAAAINEISIFDASGETLVLAFGAAGAEVDKIYIFPGGNGREPLSIPAGTRVSVKAVSANTTSGLLLINYYS